MTFQARVACSRLCTRGSLALQTQTKAISVLFRAAQLITFSCHIHLSRALAFRLHLRCRFKFVRLLRANETHPKRQKTLAGTRRFAPAFPLLLARGGGGASRRDRRRYWRTQRQACCSSDDWLLELLFRRKGEGMQNPRLEKHVASAPVRIG